MHSLRSIRPLSPDSFRGIDPAPIGKTKPKIEWVDPCSLYVEDKYQRGMGAGSSRRLIRKIYSGFSWAHFKLPVCVRLPDSGNVLVCIDGQHTAAAAASHPQIGKIPVVVVEAEHISDRAKAFVGHNRDRIGLTPMAIYKAELAAGDETAMIIDRACRAAGAEVLTTSINLNAPSKIGGTIAVGTLRSMAKNKGEEALARVLKVLVAAKRGPIRAEEIAACALSLDGVAGPADEELARVIASESAESYRAKAATLAVETGHATPIVLASIWRERMGLARPTRTMKHTSSQRAGDVLRQPREEKPAPPAAPMPTLLATTNPPAPAAPRVIERDGVRLDPIARTISRSGVTVGLSEEATRLLIPMVRVMPALLPSDRIAAEIWTRPRADARFSISQIVEKANPALAEVNLMIREMPKMGYALSDL